MARNFLAVVIGLLAALAIITIGITLNENWKNYDAGLPYEHWRYVIKNAARKNLDWFFVAMLISSGIGSLVGGTITALIVKNAKTAYAVFIGFLLFVIAYLDVIFTPYHPTWYEASILPILFFFSWLGGKLTDWLTKVLSK